jgi:hypothetical protein
VARPGGRGQQSLRADSDAASGAGRGARRGALDQTEAGGDLETAEKLSRRDGQTDRAKGGGSAERREHRAAWAGLCPATRRPPCSDALGRIPLGQVRQPGLDHSYDRFGSRAVG